MAGFAHNSCLRILCRFPPASALLLAALSAPALADDAGPFQYRISSYAGAFIPQSEGWVGSGALGGLPFTATGKLVSNTGWAAGALVGYSFENVPDWRWLNIDLAAGYVTSTFNRFDGTLNVAGLGTVPGPVPLTGEFHTNAAFLNFLATPFGVRQILDGKVTPFIGVGPGLASSTAKLQSFNLGPTAIPVNATSSETDFAFDVTLGADYALSPHLDMGLAYQYTWIDTKHLGGGAGITANSGPSSGHSLGLILEYRFGNGS